MTAVCVVLGAGVIVAGIGWGMCHVNAQERRELYRHYKENGKQ